MNIGSIIIMTLFMLIPVSVAGQNSKQKVRHKTTLKKQTKTKKNKKIRPQQPTVNLATELSKLEKSMTRIEGGKFTIGTSKQTNSKKKQNGFITRKTKISTFYLSKYEVTQALWTAVMSSNPSYFKGLDRPVESVSWDDCQKFILRLNKLTGKNYRLPTETEWEYAAKGGKNGGNTHFAGSEDAFKVAWFEENSNDSTHFVGLKTPNAFGLYDLSGNVCEWCDNDYTPYIEKREDEQSRDTIDSGGLRSGKVVRGGSWNRSLDACRVSTRDNLGPEMSNFSIGLRLAATKM